MSEAKGLFGEEIREEPLTWGVFPPAPPWRRFDAESRAETPDKAPDKVRGKCYVTDLDDLNAVNAAITLRRPLLVTGRPGCGKSSLAFAVAHRLNIEREVIKWPISSRTRVEDGLYTYDAIRRLNDSQMKGPDKVPIEQYLKLGPLGTAIAANGPVVLLIDEIDKGDIDLPNDLLNVLEEGRFPIRELSSSEERKLSDIELPTLRFDDKVKPTDEGEIVCKDFPIVVMTSNDERTFPEAFLRRCICHNVQPPGMEKLADIVAAHFERSLEGATRAERAGEAKRIIEEFTKEDGNYLPTDRLLNAIHLLLNSSLGLTPDEYGKLVDSGRN